MEKKILYWAFCGNEGTGKTVLSKAFAGQCNATWTYEPNAETEELKTLRELALNKTKQMTIPSRELCLLANRSIHHRVNVQSILGNSSMLVTDRCFLSGMVYAKLNSISFEEWFDLSEKSHITTFPQIIIYCTSTIRKMVKNKVGRENDIYDTAEDSVIASIDKIYEEAISFTQNYKNTKHIQIIRFENDFDYPVENNLERLMGIIKKDLVFWCVKNL